MYQPLDGQASPGDFAPHVPDSPFGKPSDWSLPSFWPPGLTPTIPFPTFNSPTVHESRWVEKETNGEPISVRPLTPREVRERGLLSEKGESGMGMGATDQFYEGKDGNIYFGSKNSKNIERYDY